MALYVSNDPSILRRALAASLALHLLLAFFLPTWIRSQPAELQPIETLSFAHLIHLDITRPAAHSAPRAIPRAVEHSRIVTFAHVQAELSANTHKPSRPKAVEGASGAQAAAPRRVRTQSVLYAATASTAAPAAVKENPRAATPAPAAAPGVRSVTGADTDRGGVMPLGAAQDPVLDPRVLATLQEKVGVHVTLTVTVDEDGRTQHIAFDPPLDAQTERAIEAILADADWDAAVCGGGVSCQGTATIRL